MGLVKAGPRQQLTIGGYTFDWDPTNNTNDIQLFCQMSGATNVWSSGKKGAATAGYTVLAAKTLVVLAVKIFSFGTAAPTAYLMQADNDSGAGSSTAPTNPVYAGGALVPITAAAAAVGATGETGGLYFPVATGKYATMRSSGAATESYVAIIYGKLV